MSLCVSVHRAAVGGYVGTGGSHPALLDTVREAVATGRDHGTVLDAYVARCGDDIAVVSLGEPDAAADLAQGAFRRAAQAGEQLAQHPPVTGETAAVILALDDRRDSEPVLCLLADKASAGAWNVHLYRMFADPFNTVGLITEPDLSDGFRFTVGDAEGGLTETFELPSDLHAMLRALASGGRGVIEVTSRATGQVAAAASCCTDPVLLVRCEGAFPTVGEALEPFAFPYAVPGWLGASGPLMPVAAHHDASTRSDGPPRAVGLGFQVTSDRLVGPRDLLGDPAFDRARDQALHAAEYLRRHGPFAPNGSAPKPRAAVRR